MYLLHRQHVGVMILFTSSQRFKISQSTFSLMQTGVQEIDIDYYLSFPYQLAKAILQLRVIEPKLSVTFHFLHFTQFSQFKCMFMVFIK